jgi:serine/threonine protein kinase
MNVGEQDGQTFIAMELLEGQTLEQKIGSRPLSLETLLDYAMQITTALEIAHKRGFRIHHARGQYRNHQRYQRDPDLSDEVEERGVMLPLFSRGYFGRHRAAI